MTQQLEKSANRLREVDPRLRPPDGSDNTRGVMRLVITVLLIVAVTRLFGVGAEVLVLTAIMAMIMLHEFGHFITARWAGMRVTDFFVGFGPTLWSVKRGDTRYGVKALPIGGFVRVIGMNNLEEVDPEDEPYTYRSKTYWQRLRFATAGTFMHFVIAFVLMVVLLGGFGRVVDSVPTTTVADVSTSFTPDGPPSPAKAAGLRAGDKIVAVGGVTVSRWEEVSAAIPDAAGQPIQLTVERNRQAIFVDVTPVEQAGPNGRTVGMIGIRSGTRDVTENLSWPAAVWQAGFELKSITVESTQALFGLFTPESARSYGEQLTKTGPTDPQDEGNRLLSPVGLFRVAGAAADNGVATVLFLLVAINIFVGIFNMIPLPPFDGGHVAVATYEAVMSRVKGRRHMIDMARLLPVAYVVVMALALVTVSAVWLDIVHPFDLG